MVGLLDIAAIEEGEVTVTVRGGPLSIKGLSSREIKKLLRAFPALDQALSGGSKEGITGESILEAVPQAMVEVAILGTFHENEEAKTRAREAFETLKLHEQLAILNGIMEQTFGDYWNPLLARLKGFLGGPPDARPDVSALGMESPLELRKRLRNSLRSTVTEEELFGTSHPGSSPPMPN